MVQVLERGERIEVLVDKTEDLQNQAQRFQVQGRNLRNKMWWQNMKVKVCVHPRPASSHMRAPPPVACLAVRLPARFIMSP
jgi:hypothetical protein